MPRDLSRRAPEHISSSVHISLSWHRTCTNNTASPGHEPSPQPGGGPEPGLLPLPSPAVTTQKHSLHHAPWSPPPPFPPCAQPARHTTLYAASPVLRLAHTYLPQAKHIPHHTALCRPTHAPSPSDACLASHPTVLFARAPQPQGSPCIAEAQKPMLRQSAHSVKR